MLISPEIEKLVIPTERELIKDLGSAIEIARLDSAPAYRTDLPYHNDRHIYEEALPEGLRLDARDPKHSRPVKRLMLIAGLMAHDMWSYLPLDRDEGFASKEARTAALAGPVLLEFFNETDTATIQGDIVAAGVPPQRSMMHALTPNQRKLLRADICNVGKKNTSIFLATTVSIFHEEVILALEKEAKLPAWTPFLDIQNRVLGKLLEQDLSVGSEPVREQYDGRYLGPFNITAEKNNSLLGSKRSVRNPDDFVSQYGYYIGRVLPTFRDVVPYIKGQAAA